ncbi:MAG: heme-binding protein [Sheuella sp.]|nr:heme-binding protein [Sheuella sp.]
MITRALFALLLSLNVYGSLAMATEEPPYTAILKEGDFEIREYPPLIAAEVTVTGERSDAISAGFRLLAGYIFGGNTKKQSIAMTAPVTQAPAESEKIAMTAPVTQSGSEAEWTVRFIMPQSYTLDTLPAPNDPKVKLVPLAPARFAVVKFSGLAKEPEIIEQTQLLNEFMTKQKLTATGPATLARYDPPWTLWFLRRNEVMIPVGN